MADLYSVISGIQPDQQDVLEAELLAKQILEAQFPDIDLREGTAIRDLVLRPSAFILSLCKKGFDYYFSQNTLSNIDNNSSTEVVDGLLGNLFLSRNLGSQAVINARLYFAREKAVSVTTSTSFSTDGSLLFFPPVSVTYPSTSLQYDSYHAEWYLDIDLVAAETGSQYNISSGSLLYFSNFDPMFLRAEINYLSQASIDAETNLEFIDRAASAISTRNLINKPSIENKIKQQFNYVSRLLTIGAGDMEMLRDQVEVTGFVSPGVTGSSMALSDANTKLEVVWTNHDLIVGQLVNITEAGIGPGLLSIKRQPVSVVVDASTFKIDLPITVAPRAFAAPIISKVEEDIFIHQGGAVDIHCISQSTTSLNQYTLDASGQCSITGPIYKLQRSSTSATDTPDTVPIGTAYSVTFPGHSTRSNLTFSQDVNNVLTVTIPGHCLVVGRLVHISGWPSPLSNLYLMVTEVVDQDNVILGRNLPTYTPGSGLSPTLRYVYPDSDTGFSSKQTLIINFGALHANQLASFEVDKFDYIDSIQEFLELPDNRIVCADPQARGFDIYVLDIDLTVYDLTAPNSGEVATIINNFLNNLDPGQELILADLVANLTENGISKLKTPVNVQYSYYTKDMFPAQTGFIVDVLKPQNSSSVFVLGNVTTATDTV